MTMLRKRVLLLRGGPSPEYDVSLKTGAQVLSALKHQGYAVQDVIITRHGDWILDGRIRRPDTLLQSNDVVFIALHGVYGEDGTIQRLCEQHYIPFTGSNSFPSRMAFNKDATKRAVYSTHLKMPRHVRIHTEDIPALSYIIDAIIQTFGPSYVIKPLMSGSSHGVKIVHDSAELDAALRETLTETEQCMIEEYIDGIETTCGILENFRGEQHYILPPIEIKPHAKNKFFDYQAKYDGSTEEICPATFDIALREKIGTIALHVHRTLDLSQYSRTDMIVRGDDVYFLEVNTLPGLTDESLFPKAVAAVGLPYEHLISHLVETATVRS